MFRLNQFAKIKDASKKIYQRIYNRTYEQVGFDADCGIYLGFIIGSGLASYKVIEHYNGNIYKTERILHTIFGGTIGALFGGSWGALCGYLYPYVLVGVPSIFISYNVYHKYNSNTNDKMKKCEIILDDLSLTQKPNK